MRALGVQARVALVRRKNRAFRIEQDSLRFEFLHITRDRIVTVGPLRRGQQARVI